jgi:hypothetical protein
MVEGGVVGEVDVWRRSRRWWWEKWMIPVDGRNLGCVWKRAGRWKTKEQ